MGDDVLSVGAVEVLGVELAHEVVEGCVEDVFAVVVVDDGG